MQERKGDLEFKLKSLKNDVSNVDKQGQVEETINERLCLLENSTIASVALDAESVFESHGSLSYTGREDEKDSQLEQNNAAVNATSSKLGNYIFTDYLNSSKRRKNIKTAAVKAMAKDGIDVRSYVPKTWDEMLGLIRSKETRVDDNFFSKSEITSISSANEAPEEDSTPADKPVDKLIVMCSCEEEMKHTIARRSKSVEEWAIDPPSASKKNINGDDFDPYHRASLKIKKEVDVLMEGFFGTC